MRGTDFVQSLPSDPQKRTEAIVQAVRDREFREPRWLQVPVSDEDGNSGFIYVMDDALAIGEKGDYVRVNVSADCAQLVADELWLLLPSTKTSEAVYIWAQRGLATTEPQTQPYEESDRIAQGYSPSMMDNEACIRHDEDVWDARETVAAPSAVVCNAGKDWVVSNALLDAEGKPTGKGANFGWFDSNGQFMSPGGLKCLQPLGTVHSSSYWDYSQTLRLLYPKMIVNGQWCDVQDVAADPKLCGLISHEGPVESWRQPTVPADTIPPPSPVRLKLDRVLQKGMDGADVNEWQRFLVGQEYDLGTYGPEGNGVDGDFGNATDQATRDFQDEHVDPLTSRPLDVDGKVGPATTRAANAVLLGNAAKLKLGIDVSHHQNPDALDYPKLAETHAFVIVRATYGTTRDRKTAEHVKQAREAGLTVGLYHFFRPSQGAAEQAQAFAAVADEVGIGAGDIVPMIDVEMDPIPLDQDPEPSWVQPLAELADLLSEHFGTPPGFYITQSDWNLLGRPDWMLGHPLWVAHWTTAEQPATPANEGWEIWQYAVEKLAGVYGDKLDLNRALYLPVIP